MMNLAAFRKLTRFLDRMRAPLRAVGTMAVVLGSVPACVTVNPSGPEAAVGALTSEVVTNVTCTSAVVGNYCCGDFTSGGGCTPGQTLLRCTGKNTTPTSATTCTAGCRTMPAGQADYCNIGPMEIEKLMTAARAALNTKGGQCKEWVRTVVTSTLPGVAVPPTAGNQYEWSASDPASVHAQRINAWRGTDVTVRQTSSVPAKGTVSTSFSLSDGDSYVVVLYGATAQATVINARGTTVVSALGAQLNGKVSDAFSGSGTYSLKLTNPGTASTTVTAVVLSSARFGAAFSAARRGDVMQMYGEFTAGSVSPHTALVQIDGNGSGKNWIDSNWCLNNCEIVSEHELPTTKMIGAMAKSPGYGFTVYRLQ